MKNRMLYMLLFGVYLFYACDSDTAENFPTQVIQDSRVSDSIFEILLDDAKLICMDFYTNQEMEELSEIEFKEYHFAPILAALQTVYLDSISTASSDIRKYNVHALCPEKLHKTRISIDTTNENFNSWKSYGFSDNLSLDLLINEYDLQLDSIRETQYMVHTGTGINQESLASELKKFTFIKKAQAANCIGDGSHIEIIYFNPDFIQLIYSYGWGDCPSGCTNRHYWELGIYGSGLIELLSESGKELP
jgi:hypothetical protein